MMSMIQEESAILADENRWTIVYGDGYKAGREAGFKEGFDEGKKAGDSEVFDKAYDIGKQKGREEILKAICEKVFSSESDFGHIVSCAELFIKRFNINFPRYSIVDARLGSDPSGIPTAMFVIDVPCDMPEEEDERLDNLKREIEIEFMKAHPGNPVCIWSVEKNEADMGSIEVDFPFFRKVS